MRKSHSLSHLIIGVLLLAFSPLLSLAQPRTYIPVLCYHGFTDDSKSGRGESYERFESLLEFLSKNGYASCFPGEVISGSKLPERKVIFTFDDGSKSHVRAAQILEKYGFKGIFFVIPDRIRETDEKFLTRGEIQLLAEHGHLIGAHGFQHKSMVDSVLELKASQESSKKILRTIVGERQHTISNFAFPFGYYNNQIVKQLRHEFKYLHTVNPGYWDGKSILIPRMLIDSHTNMEFYIDYIRGSTKFNQTVSLVTEDGVTSDIVKFALNSEIGLDKIELFSVSRDTSGQINVSHPLGNNLSLRENILEVNVKNHLRRYYSPDRRVISYALVSREDGRIKFLTCGHLQWVTQ